MSDGRQLTLDEAITFIFVGFFVHNDTRTQVFAFAMVGVDCVIQYITNKINVKYISYDLKEGLMILNNKIVNILMPDA